MMMMIIKTNYKNNSWVIGNVGIQFIGNYIQTLLWRIIDKTL